MSTATSETRLILGAEAIRSIAAVNATWDVAAASKTVTHIASALLKKAEAASVDRVRKESAVLREK